MAEQAFELARQPAEHRNADFSSTAAVWMILFCYILFLLLFFFLNLQECSIWDFSINAIAISMQVKMLDEDVAKIQLIYTEWTHKIRKKAAAK